jgi:hypothetical protein
MYSSNPVSPSVDVSKTVVDPVESGVTVVDVLVSLSV